MAHARGSAEVVFAKPCWWRAVKALRCTLLDASLASSGRPFFTSSFTGCRRAVDEFRQERGITAPLMWQAIADSGFSKDSTENKWEAAWWIKDC